MCYVLLCLDRDHFWYETDLLLLLLLSDCFLVVYVHIRVVVPCYCSYCCALLCRVVCSTLLLLLYVPGTGFIRIVC